MNIAAIETDKRQEGVNNSLAIDIPVGPWEEDRLAASSIEWWKLILAQQGFTAEGLPRAFDEYGGLIEENKDKSQEVLSRVGGLVIASYRVKFLGFDMSVLLHIDQAAEAGIPAFVQKPYDEVIQAGSGRLPGEVIVMELHQTSEIRERLGE